MLFCIVKAINKLKVFGGRKTVSPKVKKCPYCLSEINIKATKCPCCTSELKDEKKTA